MRIHRRPSHIAAAAALVFGLSGYFASIAATTVPTWLRSRPILCLLLFITCVLAGFALLLRAQLPAAERSSLEEKYDDVLYHYRSALAPSIRLVGARDETFPPARVHTDGTTEPYRLPDEFLATREQVVPRLRAHADSHGQMFFDGPNTRLVSYTATPRDATEDKHLTLKFGPIGWHDYSVGKWHLDRMLHPPDLKRLAEFVDLDEVAQSGVIRNSGFSNICCTATTIVTRDGFLAYSLRSDRVSSQSSKLTSCIAENMHQTKDRSLEPSHGAELPSPYRAAIRGAEEELSPTVAEFLRARPANLILLGMDFDLDSMQPDLLFILIWPGTLTDLRDKIKRNRGRDFVEGSMQAVRFRSDELEHLLLQPGWVPGGKASVIRAVEFINAMRRRFPGASYSSVLDRAASGML